MQRQEMEGKKRQREEEARLRKEKKDEEARQKEEIRKQKEVERLKKLEKEEGLKRAKEDERRRIKEKKQMEEDEKNERLKKKKEEKEEKLKKEEEMKIAKEKKLEKQKDFMKSFFTVLPKKEPVLLDGSSSFGIFPPFEVQEGVRVAPRLRVQPWSPSRVRSFDAAMAESTVQKEDLYLAELKSKKHIPRKSAATCSRKKPTANNTEITVDDDDEMESTLSGFNYTIKLIQFSENARTPWYGTWRKPTDHIRPRNPFAMDMGLDYDNDSDEDWEEEQALEEVDECSDAESSGEEVEEEEEADGFILEDEMEGEIDIKEEGGPPKVMSNIARWLKKDTLKRPKRVVIGPYWPNQNIPCPDKLKNLPITRMVLDINEMLDKAQGHEDLGDGISKIPELMMPFLIKLLHGSLAKKDAIARAFYHLWDAKDKPAELATAVALLGDSLADIIKTIDRPREMTKTLLINVISKISTWDRPPLIESSRKRCHYVIDTVRTMYKVLEGPCLPNAASVKTAAEKRKLEESVNETPNKAPRMDTTPNKVLQMDTSSNKMPRADSPEIPYKRRITTVHLVTQVAQDLGMDVDGGDVKNEG